MTLSCLRRPRRAEDRLPDWLDPQALGPGLAFQDARRVASADDPAYWVVPTDDRQGVLFFGTTQHGGGGGIATFESLAERGAVAHLGIRRGRWRCALLIVDGYERVRAGMVESAVADNFAVLDLPDRERFVWLDGPAGARSVDLGPSDWDDFWTSDPGGTDLR